MDHNLRGVFTLFRVTVDYGECESIIALSNDALRNYTLGRLSFRFMFCLNSQGLGVCWPNLSE